MKHKPNWETCNFEFNAIGEPQAGEFEGMASVFNVPIDAHVPTIIEPGAFQKTISERYRNREALERVKILFNHDMDQPIGRPIALEETEQGLRIKGKISGTDVGDRVRTLMADKVLDSMSIGFDTLQSKNIVHDGKWGSQNSLGYRPEVMQQIADGDMWRHIQEIRLWEVSIVVFPASSMALISDVHEQQDSIDQLLETLLARVPLEAHEGKVLSAKNKKLLQDAVAAIEALLAAAEPPPPPVDDGMMALTVNAERASRLRQARLRAARLQL